ncbi:hypothetical protein VE01_07738 [Pseudogymnoascus verrucosus]|uniref:Uncharacterized protein n=1 Tax=Pseudogymnoascus verrucosus TaxID=342668 RepID=A0A1B8GEW9_9PEZI|nr:uncharacterized protein VE01_07738 [Pseudogymnoascus verrucosus]OBT94382.1 hypothetical protein VE01_07738 [Pseudogymnoascus verrucosus]
MEAFEQELLILMHYTGGQPARAPEVMGTRYQNSRNGGVRNIFIEDGLVCFVTSYHKGYESSEKLKRDAVIAIGRKFLRDIFNDGSTPEDCDVEGFDEDNEEGDKPWDLQSGHGTHVAGNIYTRLVTEGKFETMSKREQFRTIMARVGRKRKRSPWEKADREFQLERWKQLRTANIYRGLAALLGPDKEFRGKQRSPLRPS